MGYKKYNPEEYKDIEWMDGSKLEGQRYGMLTVLKQGRRPREVQRENQPFFNYYLLCQCDCGELSVKYQSIVRSGKSTSCGCKVLNKPKWTKQGEVGLKNKYCNYKYRAKKRGYEFNLTFDEFAELVVQPCIYCGRQKTQVTLKGRWREFNYTGIDRYDNTKGYVIENCVPCCYACNEIKMTRTIEEMEKHLELMLSRKHIRNKK